MTEFLKEDWWADKASDADCDSKDLTGFIIDQKRKRKAELPLSPESYDFIIFIAGN